MAVATARPPGKRPRDDALSDDPSDASSSSSNVVVAEKLPRRQPSSGDCGCRLACKACGCTWCHINPNKWPSKHKACKECEGKHGPELPQTSNAGGPLLIIELYKPYSALERRTKKLQDEEWDGKLVTLQLHTEEGVEEDPTGRHYLKVFGRLIHNQGGPNLNAAHDEGRCCKIDGVVEDKYKIIEEWIKRHTIDEIPIDDKETGFPIRPGTVAYWRMGKRDLYDDISDDN
jgi:hypothetical protein